MKFGINWKYVGFRVGFAYFSPKIKCPVSETILIQMDRYPEAILREMLNRWTKEIDFGVSIKYAKEIDFRKISTHGVDKSQSIPKFVPIFFFKKKNL